jgi:hypothetical protein
MDSTKIAMACHQQEYLAIAGATRKHQPQFFLLASVWADGTSLNISSYIWLLEQY